MAGNIVVSIRCPTPEQRGHFFVGLTWVLLRAFSCKVLRLGDYRKTTRFHLLFWEKNT